MHVVVVGAGVGGITAALRLAKGGCRVTLLEQGERVGGKLNLWQPEVPGVGRFRFDTGPHVLTMPWTFQELFSFLGERVEDYITLERVDPLCRYHFPDSPPFDAPANLQAAAQAVAQRFPGEESGFCAYLNYSRQVHDATLGPFLTQDFGAAVRGIPSPRQWAELARFLALQPWRTLASLSERHFKSPRLRQIFDLYALYNGSSPERASALFAIIAWIQWGEGTFYLKGGLRTYADALAALLEKFGVDLRLRTRAVPVWHNRRRPRIYALDCFPDGAETYRLPADRVVWNGDPVGFYQALGPEAPASLLPRQEPSTSAFVLLLGVRGTPQEDFSHLSHYNSFLPADPAQELRSVFKWGLPADDPVIGVTCQSVSDPTAAPSGYTNLFIMTSPPPLSSDFAWTPEDTLAYRERIMGLLETRCQLSGLRERIVCEQVWTPQTFADRYGAWRGSLYGPSSNGVWSAFTRPPNRVPGVEGVYFVGGGTHPGGGLPLVTLSGRIVAESILYPPGIQKKNLPGFQKETGLHHPDGQ